MCRHGSRRLSMVMAYAHHMYTSFGSAHRAGSEQKRPVLAGVDWSLHLRSGLPFPCRFHSWNLSMRSSIPCDGDTERLVPEAIFPREFEGPPTGEVGMSRVPGPPAPKGSSVDRFPTITAGVGDCSKSRLGAMLLPWRGTCSCRKSCYTHTQIDRIFCSIRPTVYSPDIPGCWTDPRNLSILQPFFSQIPFLIAL